MLNPLNCYRVSMISIVYIVLINVNVFFIIMPNKS